MNRSRSKKTEYIGFALEPQLRSSLEEEALRRDMPMSAVIRALLKSQLAASPSVANLKAA